MGKPLKNAWYDTEARVTLSFWISRPSFASTACREGGGGMDLDLEPKALFGLLGWAWDMAKHNGPI